MRSFFSHFIALLLFPTMLIAQGEYVLLLPQYTDHGTYEGDYDIGMTKFSASGTIAHGALVPTKVSSLALREYAPSVVKDSDGGSLLGWTIEHVDPPNAGDTDILLKRLDESGKEVWEDDESGSVRFLAQSAHLERNPHMMWLGDGIIVVYEIEYRSGDYSGDVDIIAMKVNLNGELLWDQGSWIARSDRRETIAGLYENNGRVGILFNRRGGTDPHSPADIFSTVINGDGTIGWTEEVMEVALAASPHHEHALSYDSDGSGGAFLAYQIDYTSGSKEGNSDIVAQHLTADGIRSWIDPTNPPMVASSGLADEVRPTIIADSAGVIIAYEIHSTSSTGGSERSIIGAQRLDLDGNAVWNNGTRSNPIPVKNRIGLHPGLVQDGNGGAYVIFDGVDTITGDRDVFAQRVGVDGRLAWNKDHAIPVFFGPMPESLIAVLEDGENGVVVVAAESNSYRVTDKGPRDTSFIAHRIDYSGAHTWGLGEHNLLLTRATIGTHSPVVVPVR